MAQSCDDEAAEVTGWPIDQIQSAVQPNPQQSALLDDLGNAVVEASHQIRTHCPTTVAFTPTGRLDQMHERLQTLVTIRFPTSRRRALTASPRRMRQAMQLPPPTKQTPATSQTSKRSAMPM
jgi:hypothetical protein